MRVLVGMPDKDSLGGPIACEPPFVAALRALGHEVDEETYVYGEGATPTSIFKRVTRVLAAARRLRRRTREHQYDIIHLSTSIDEKSVMRDLVMFTFLGSSTVPVFLKMQGSIASFLATKSKFWRSMQHRIYAKAAGIGVQSNEELENFIRAGCPPEKMSISKLAIETDTFINDPNFRERLGLAPNVPVLLFSSRFVATKGLLTVIEACGELKQSGREFALFCLGDGPDRDEAEQLVDELGLREYVNFTGYIPESETVAFHANSTMFVFPTYHDEGFPVVLLKSLAGGLPIITTRTRAAADLFTDPENCIFVEPRDPHTLAAAITRLLDDVALRETMSANNHRLAEQYAPEPVAREYLALYQAIIARN